MELITKRYANFCQSDVHAGEKLYVLDYNTVSESITRLLIQDLDL